MTEPAPEPCATRLTGLGNHRAFQEEMERQWATAVRHGQALALALVDLDDFRRTNDSSGHAAGDEVLRFAATTIAGASASLRPRLPGRWRRVRDHLAQHRRGAWPAGRPPSAGRLPRRRPGRRTGGDACPSRPVSARSRATPATANGCTARPMPPCTGQSCTAGRVSRPRPRCPRWTDRRAAAGGALRPRPAIAATGAFRAVFQPIYDLTSGAPRGFEGLVRPLPDSGFADARPMFEAAEATGRTAELDIACLNTVMETAARLRLPGR